MKFAVRLGVYNCAIIYFMRKTLYVSSVYHLTAISFERYELLSISSEYHLTVINFDF